METTTMEPPEAVETEAPVTSDAPAEKPLFIPTSEWDEINWNILDNPRIKHTDQVPTNLIRLLSGGWDLEKRAERRTRNNTLAKKSTSPEALEKILADPDIEDIEKAPNKCLDRLIVPRPRLVPVVRELAKMYPKSSLQLSGFFLYPEKGGYMGWHTNTDSPYTRLYITHTFEAKKSFFRYRLNGECATSWDVEGWSMRQFGVGDDEPLWHCVYADTKRLSIGFRINRNLKK